MTKFDWKNVCEMEEMRAGSISLSLSLSSLSLSLSLSISAGGLGPSLMRANKKKLNWNNAWLK